MAKYYKTSDGKRLLTEWGWGDEYERNTATAMRAVRKIFPRLIVEAGSGFLCGFAYTSTSKVAAVWNCNTQARRNGERTDGGRAYLDGVAIDDGGRAVYIWTIYNADGYEVGEEYTAVGDL